MDPIILSIEFNELSDDSKYIISIFLVMFLILLVILIVYVLLLITTLLYNFIRIEKNTQYTRLYNNTEIN
jgi:heme/copper-type cytochrome/quinol oxidase subunit 2